MASGQKTTEHYSQNRFISNEAHRDHPPLRMKDFIFPKLGRFTQALKLGQYLGNGIQGAAFKSSLDDGTEVVAKVFFEPCRPEEEIFFWAWETECMNAAILHLMRERCDKLEKEDKSIYLLENPQTFQHARFNIQAFCDELLITKDPYAEDQTVEDEIQDAETIKKRRSAPGQKPFRPKIPTPRCYGWTELPGSVVTKALHKSKVRDDHGGGRFPEDSTMYPVIVYQYVPKGSHRDLKPSIIDESLKLLHVLGFVLREFKEVNWHGEGVLVDHADIVSCVINNGLRWSVQTFRAGAPTCDLDPDPPEGYMGAPNYSENMKVPKMPGWVYLGEGGYFR